MKNVLVTGGTGFIGSHLCETLVESGYNVTAYDQYNSNNNWNWLENSSKKIFLKNVFKIGYSQNTKIKKNKLKNEFYIIKAFQRRFRQELINGKIDKECLLISQNLMKVLRLI